MHKYLTSSFLIILENMEEDGMYTTTCDIVEIGPLNMPKLNNLRRIKDMVRDIPSNWWTDFPTWKDFHGILRSGSKLSMHYIVTKINSPLELLENNMSYVDVIDDNGNIIIQHDESFPTLA
jgi:hypothetical protein